ncbi:Two component system, signal transduction histidine kinase, sporulation regulator spoob [Acididesulfobacillus acetoxydans]|uniref:Signal transduction histidine kinase, sporulation regulator SpoOB n=2 Tax=Acididesulfobacillus acetoxydans TaxID=1561005 RepID=A0A8S0WV81_9FIRM|nr:Two component system, signal transduction histidine kinase, sporulation regulator spoob [Acididesulfobacillus acetoxydans]CEJ06773.1 Signal transduction histidine kinase, sporulation regulator SpoOB [Acididesulfobacillus acetoxydans]
MAMDRDCDERLAEKLLTEQLAWYRLQRHDFMNHWQVVMGYLQLKQADKALAYLRGITDSERAEQRLGRIPEPYVAAVLLGLILRLRQEEIACEVELAEEPQGDTFWRAPRQPGYAESLYGYTTECLALGRSYLPACPSLEARVILTAAGKELEVSFELYRRETHGESRGEKIGEWLAGKKWRQNRPADL